MNRVSKGYAVIILIVAISSLNILVVKPANAQSITSDITVTPIKNFNDTTYPQGDYLSIKGTVTNHDQDTAYNVGLKVSATALVFSHYTTVIEVTVPVQSGTYNTGESYQLSTLNPNQTISLTIIIYPDYQSQEPDLSNSNVTLVWSPTSSPTPTSTVPELSWLTILPILLIIPIVLIIFRKTVSRNIL
jgi:hypothetical protein